jgi:V8-like Glu-specific endopeptidase
MSCVRAVFLAVTLAALAAAATIDPAPLLTVGGSDPNAYVVDIGQPEFFGVARLEIGMPNLGSLYCSGALVNGGYSILTAGHCLWTTYQGHQYTGASITATFPGGEQVTSADFDWHPTWTSVLGAGVDLGLIQLGRQLTGVPFYEIAETRPVYGSTIIEMAGWGRSGTGTSGHALPSGVLRVGTNVYDGWWGDPGHPYAFDFDDGSEARNPLGSSEATSREVLTVPGDSGGPSFIREGDNLLIVGVHSFYGRYEDGTDYDGTLNGTFGEVGGDTDVVAYADFVDTPEPASPALAAVGLLAAVALKRRVRGL